MKRVLFVFGWLVIGGEETEVRHLARHINPMRYRLGVVACQRRPGMPELGETQLEEVGVEIDRAPYSLTFDDTVTYLASRFADVDLVVACQAVPDAVLALERCRRRPPLIEHGGLVSEATAGPKHLTTRYVGVCRSIREAAASVMPGREHHVLEIPSMVDVAEFDAASRARTRAELGLPDDAPVVGWVGRLDRKKRVEDVLHAARLVLGQRPGTRFILVGGPDAFMPEYEEELHALTVSLGLEEKVIFLGDRPDVPALLCAFDIFVWLSRAEGMPHVIAEAGAASLPVVATRDNGSAQQLCDEISGLHVPHEAPGEVAAAVVRLLDDKGLRQRLGGALREKVEREYSVQAVVPRWEQLFDEVLLEDSR